MCGALQQENADADAFKNCFYLQSGVIWKDQLMREDPLEATLGIMRVSSLPRSCAPPPPGWCLCVVCLVCVCVLGVRPSCFCSVSASAGLT